MAPGHVTRDPHMVADVDYVGGPADKKRRDFMHNAALAAAATFTPGMTFAQKADAVEDELEHRLMLAQGMGMGGGATREPPPMPERPTIVDFMRLRFYDSPDGGIQQNSHMLQSASLALKAGYDEKVVVACALHDTGHQIKRVDHGHWGSNLVEGYVDEEISWAIKYHQSLRFFPDPDYNYEYPEMYIRNSLQNLGSATSYVTVGANWVRVSSTPLRLYKTFTSEGGTRVPAILRWPGRVAAGQMDRNYFQVADLMPTLLELAGVEHPGESGESESGILPMQGRPVTNLWLQEIPAYGDADYAFHTYTETRLGGGFARRGDWKLAWWKEDGEFMPRALFNLADNPAEIRDRTADHPEIAAELAQALLNYAAQNGVDIESAGSAGSTLTSPPPP